jgi:DNA-binding IclR family transcriptional regulator
MGQSILRDGVSTCGTPGGWRGGAEGVGGAVSRALEKGLMLLSLIAEGHDTLPRLARVSGMIKSTAHRLAAVLVRQGLLRNREGRFVLGYRFLELSERARRQTGYLTVARHHLESLSSETGETVHLGELADGHVVYLEKIEGQRSLQMRSYAGLRVPARTALGIDSSPLGHVRSGTVT